MTDVIVVGAGPTGLLLAGDLAAAGVRVTVLERRTTESNLTRAFAVHARTLEQLDARGLADPVVAAGNAVAGLRLFGSVSVDLSSVPSRFPYLLVTPQYEVEQVLLERALDAGAAVLRGAHVQKVRQNADRVEVTYRDPDGATQVRHASWLVGTDGHHSTVRRELDLDFPGESVVRSLMLADVRMTDPPPTCSPSTATPAGSASSSPTATAGTGSSPATPIASCPTTRPSRSTRSPTSPAGSSAPTGACTTRGGCPASTATNGRSAATEWGGCSSPATPPTCTPPPAGRA